MGQRQSIALFVALFGCATLGAQERSELASLDGSRGESLDRYVTGSRYLRSKLFGFTQNRGSLGWVAPAMSSERGEWEIESLLSYWHRYENLQAFREGFANSEGSVEIVGHESVHGIPCVILQRNGRQNYRWSVAVAPAHDFVIMQLRIWSPGDAPAPVEWIDVERVSKFDNVWFPVVGQYGVHRPQSQKDWIHDFRISKVTLQVPVDRATFDVVFPPNTIVFNKIADTQFRVLPDGSIPAQALASDPALAQTYTKPGATGASRSKVVGTLVLGLLASAAIVLWLRRRRRRRLVASS